MCMRLAILLIFVLRLATAASQAPERILLNTDKQWYYPGESIWLSINTFNACSNRLMQLSAVAYVEMVAADGKAVLRSKIKIDDAMGIGELHVGNNIATGVYSLVAYTNWMKNQGQRSFARKPLYVVNPARTGTMNVKYSVVDEQPNYIQAFPLSSDKHLYEKREQVTLKFSTGSASRVSVSVFKTNALEKGIQHLYLSEIDDPCGAVISGPANFYYENEGQVISGKVTDKQTKLPVKGVRYYMSTVGFPEMFSTATSDSAGTIRFLAGDLAGKNELILLPQMASDHYNIELMSPYMDSVESSLKSGDEDVFVKYGEVINESIVDAQVQNIFSREARMPHSSDSGKVVFYARPDAYYRMSDYVHFNSVEEILREIVTMVNVRKRGGKLFPVVLNLYSKKPYRNPPLILVNGVPVLNVDEFMNMNTDDIYSIGVKARSYYAGNAVFYGILDVRLNGAYTMLPKHAQIVDFQGVQSKVAFSVPDYTNNEKRADRTPDFRSTLYWNPKVETISGDGVIRFFTSDIGGEYVVVAQAVSRDGHVTASKTSIQVK